MSGANALRTPSADEVERPARKARSDGQRNRELLIETAKASFAEDGPEVSLELIARRAGVGIGTLYRHFPTRNGLVEAVCRHEVEQLGRAAVQLADTLGPAEALHRWMRLVVDYIATKKVLATVVTSVLGLPADAYRESAAQIMENPLFGADTDIYRSSTARIVEAIHMLAGRAIAAGAIRPDITGMDLIRAIAGFTITYGDDTEGWKTSALRLVDVLHDGLCKTAD